jgi:hypothetical protein
MQPADARRARLTIELPLTASRSAISSDLFKTL